MQVAAQREQKSDGAEDGAEEGAEEGHVSVAMLTMFSSGPHPMPMIVEL